MSVVKYIFIILVCIGARQYSTKINKWVYLMDSLISGFSLFAQRDGYHYIYLFDN